MFLRCLLVCVVAGMAVGSTFEQITCDDRECEQGCVSKTYHLDTCLPTIGGGSTVVLTCASTGMDVLEYLIASDCSGFAVNGVQPVGTCVRQGGIYFKNLCNGDIANVSTVPLPAVNTSLVMRRP